MAAVAENQQWDYKEKWCKTWTGSSSRVSESFSEKKGTFSVSTLRSCKNLHRCGLLYFNFVLFAVVECERHGKSEGNQARGDCVYHPKRYNRSRLRRERVGPQIRRAWFRLEGKCLMLKLIIFLYPLWIVQPFWWISKGGGLYNHFLCMSCTFFVSLLGS